MLLFLFAIIDSQADEEPYNIRYKYDALNRLIREDNEALDKTTLYEYAINGNITKVKEYGYTTAASPSGGTTTSYTYGSRPDQLTKVGTKTISGYAAAGNPASYKGTALTWFRGRMLKSCGGSAHYAYDANGVRVSKTVNGTKHSYFTNGTQILSEKFGSTVLTYLYDGSGVIGLRKGSDYYYFLKNQQGDVKLITDDEGNLQCRYVYDAWGNHKIYTAADLDITNNASYNTTIAKQNPFRYRGYYYDTESGFYYLNSRYYDPEVRRFINADDPSIPAGEQATVFGGLNLYAYCLNNPVNMIDPSGHFPVMATLCIVALIGMALTIAGVASDNNALTAVGLTMVTIPALISGGLAAFGATGLLATIAGGMTMAAGVGTGLFASAEWQQTFTDNNWMLDAGMSEEVYNGLMLTTAAIATLGTVASATSYSLKMDKMLQIGKIKGVRASKGYSGIRFSDKTGSIRSLELHSAHEGHGIHLQLNNWWLNKAGYVGKYYRAFSKHLEIFKFWRGWF